MLNNSERAQIWQKITSEGLPTSPDKKQKIIEATIHLMASQGIEAVTFEAIGQALKTTKANIRYHFNDKDELIFLVGRLVVSNAQGMTASLVSQATSPEAKLLAVIDGAYAWYEAYPAHFKVWLLFIYYVHFRNDYREFYENARDAGQDRLQLLLRALSHERMKPADYEKLAEAIQNILYGQIISMGGRTSDLRKNKATAVEIIGVLLESKGFRCPK